MSPAVSQALRLAAQLLARRDLSVAGLQARLEEAGHAQKDAQAAVDWLQRQRYLDDHGVAHRETEKAVTRRGWGRLRIEARLEDLEVSADATEAALECLDEETEKSLAAIALSKRFKGKIEVPKAARFLAGRGFSEEAVRAALDAASPDWEEQA
ncbi:MAG: regulatory protein RecX [Fimbriimonadaceae bacterium]